MDIEHVKDAWRRLSALAEELNDLRDNSRALVAVISGLSRKEVDTWPFDIVEQYLDLAIATRKYTQDL